MSETTRGRNRFRGATAKHEELFAAGFHRARGNGSYQRGRLSLTRDGHWYTVKTKAKSRDIADGALGRPGLWKVVHIADGRREWNFDLPPLHEPPDEAPWIAAGDEVDGDERAATPLRLMLEWAAGTADGQAPEGWQPPPAEALRQWAAPAALAVRSGGIVRQVEVVSEPARLALRCRVVVAPAELSPERRAWLDRLALDANDRWRLVRLGWEDSGDSDDGSKPGPNAAGLVAEVDLTGCPVGLLESVFRTALAALRWVVGWCVGAADFLADPACGSALLEAAPQAGPSAVLAPA